MVIICYFYRLTNFKSIVYSNHEGLKQAVGEHNDSILNVFWIYLVYNKTPLKQGTICSKVNIIKA